MDRGENIAQSDSAVTIPPRQTGELSTTTKPRVRDLPTIASTTTSVPIKTCKEVKCLFNGTCNMETLQCMCKRCEYHKRMPVCGKDGVTYNSNCDLMYTQCEIQKFIPIDHQGECKQVPIPTVKPDHSSDHGGSEHHIPDKPPVDTDSAVNEPTAQSPKAGYNPCANGSCDSADRPSLGNGAIVYVVFGINGIDQSNLTGEHVLEESRGSVIYTDQPLDFNDADILKSICTICKNIVNQENPKLVTKGGAQCFPTEFEDKIDMLGFIYPECKDIPKPALLKGQKSHSMAARLSENEFVFRWYALAFESGSYLLNLYGKNFTCTYTTFQGVSSFAAYKDFLEWEKLITKEVEKLPEDSPLRSAFQTCEFWKTIFMEVLGVTSAIYGLVFSMLVCVLSVAVFTGHVGLLVVVMLTISGMNE
uniref:Patched domain-containing protein 2-like n=1 Tax=Saccoglossus kowalevskii TaxID=10224 RepID=A0ABM0M2B1_SACKO|nr:PREDICTED: patched domain-containing protein 2-like [Saccoglossus kowalevskii]